MLERPDISDDAIVARVYDAFGLRIAQVTFLPIGWVNNAAYRLTADTGTRYFLKLRGGHFDAVAAAVPAWLHAQGIPQVMAPIPTTTGDLWLRAHGFGWILYPFFDGRTGFEAALSEAHWNALGRCMRAIHTARLPAALAEHLPREAYSPRWRESVRAFHRQVGQARYADPIAASLAAFWLTKRDEIECIVARAEQLASALRRRRATPVVCHSDLHGRNVLAGAGGRLAIVDWDQPILAPKERDLMFIGGGIGGIWNGDREVAWFYHGYGPAEVDLLALSYYRYERIVVDIAERAEQIFGVRGSAEERRKGLRLRDQFLPNNVVDIAHRTYQRLA